MGTDKEFTVDELVDINEGLQLIINHEFSDFTLSYRIGKLAKNVGKVIDHLSEERMKIIRKYGEPDDKGNYTLKQSSEKFQVAEKAINKLLQEKETIKVPKLPISLFKDEKLTAKFYKLCDAIIIDDL